MLHAQLKIILFNLVIMSSVTAILIVKAIIILITIQLEKAKQC